MRHLGFNGSESIWRPLQEIQLLAGVLLVTMSGDLSRWPRAEAEQRCQLIGRGARKPNAVQYIDIFQASHGPEVALLVAMVLEPIDS